MSALVGSESVLFHGSCLVKTNLVPFKNAHFLINGLAPLNSKASGKPPWQMLSFESAVPTCAGQAMSFRLCQVQKGHRAGPVTTDAVEGDGHQQVQPELDCLEEDNVTVKCDPLNPGDEFHVLLAWESYSAHGEFVLAWLASREGCVLCSMPLESFLSEAEPHCACIHLPSCQHRLTTAY